MKKEAEKKKDRAVLSLSSVKMNSIATTKKPIGVRRKSIKRLETDAADSKYKGEKESTFSGSRDSKYKVGGDSKYSGSNDSKYKGGRDSKYLGSNDSKYKGGRDSTFTASTASKYKGGEN